MSSIAFNNNPEDNPFADPFARSNSPDPWASYSGQPAYEQPQEQEEPAAPTPTSPVRAPASAPVPTSPTSPGGSRGFRYIEEDIPVESPTKRKDSVTSSLYSDIIADQPLIPAVKPSYSAFSQQSPLHVQEDSTDNVATPKPQHAELPLPIPSSPPPPAPSHDGPSIPSQSQPRTSSDSPQPRSPTQDRIQTPLDLPAPPAGSGSGWGSYLTNQFTELSLGGEVPGSGWRAPEPEPTPSTESSFVNGTKHESEPDELQEHDQEVEVHHAQQANGTTDIGGGPSSYSHALQPVFQITVEDPQKIGADPIRAYTMYTVHTKTTSPLYSRASFTVLRRYSDFVWLYETLSASNPGVVVPPIPEKNPFSRFQDTFIEQRRLGLQQCIQKIANHPVLCNDPDLKFFLESDSFALDMKHRKSGTMDGQDRGLMSTIGSTIVGTKFYEIDEWFDQKKAYLDSLEAQLKGLAKAIDFVAKNRQELAISLAEMSNSLSELSAADLSKPMTHHIASLADVTRKSKEMHDIQAREDTLTIMNTVDEYIRIIASVRLAFASRVRVYTAWQAADTEVRRVRANQDKARRQGRLPNDRAAFSLAELQDAERRALDSKQEFDKCSRLIKMEIARFEKERIEEFKNALESLLHGMIARQKDIIRSWELYQEQMLKRVTQQQQQPPPPPQEPSTPLPPPPAVPHGFEETDVNPFAS